MSSSRQDAAQILRKLIGRAGAIPVPGVFNPAVALLAEKAGFECAYLSGGAFSGSLGLPDLGLTTLTEVSDAVSKMTAVSRLPLIVDVDTGFGEAVNLRRTVIELRRAGAAAIQIEDQVMPKRCGHLEGKELVQPLEMVKKLVAARDANKGGLLIVGRTDATAVEGLDKAIERAKLYLDAGADIIFPEALTSEEEFAEFARKVKAPLLANMTEFGRTPYLTLDEFSNMGYKLVIFPVTAFRLAMHAIEKGFEELARSGTQKGLLEAMMTREEFYKLIDYHSYEKNDKETARRASGILDRS